MKENIKKFVVNFSNDPGEAGGGLRLKQAMIEKLNELPSEGFWTCGFSIDNSDIVRFHALPTTLQNKCDYANERVIPLDEYSRMFELSEVEEVPSS